MYYAFHLAVTVILFYGFHHSRTYAHTTMQRHAGV